jgi:hypothetical protein
VKHAEKCLGYGWGLHPKQKNGDHNWWVFPWLTILDHFSVYAVAPPSLEHSKMPSWSLELCLASKAQAVAVFLLAEVLLWRPSRQQTATGSSMYR